MAGGSGIQFGDHPASFCNDPSGVCYNATGGSTDGYTWFTDGANPWRNEYYWLDGEVTLMTQEGTGLYNIGVNITSESFFSFVVPFIFFRVSSSFPSSSSQPVFLISTWYGCLVCCTAGVPD